MPFLTWAATRAFVAFVLSKYSVIDEKGKLRAHETPETSLKDLPRAKVFNMIS